MRKLLLILLIIIPLVAFGILILKNKNTNPQNSNAENILATPVSETSKSIKIDNLTFAWYEVNNIDNLKLIPNFNERLSSKEVIKNNSCKFLSNAGFYATGANSAYHESNSPIGLFITNGATISEFQTNALFDGILSINDLATPRITRNIPQDHLQIAVQSGPILIENSNPISLKIISDENDRRLIATITGDNKLIFLTIYQTNSEYSGPLLADVPNLLKQFETKANVAFADAINLDGGSASTFNTSSSTLSELNPSGAFFCQL